MFRADDIARAAAELAPKPANLDDLRDYVARDQKTLGEPARGPLLLGPGPAIAPPRPWLTLDEAAEYSGLPASAVARLIHAGKLRALDVGIRPGGRYRIRRADLDALEGDRLAENKGASI